MKYIVYGKKHCPYSILACEKLNVEMIQYDNIPFILKDFTENKGHLTWPRIFRMKTSFDHHNDRVLQIKKSESPKEICFQT